MSLPKYPGYKHTGQSLIEQVPTHWEAGPVGRHIARISSGTSVNAIDTPPREGQLGVLKTSCVYRGNFDVTECKAVVTEEYDRVSCPLKAGTLIVSRMNTPDLVGAAGLVSRNEPGVFLPDRLWQMEFAGVDAAFAHYWTRSVTYRASVKLACTGTSSSMQNLSQGQFRAFPFPCPPRQEQRAIVAFLDRETAKIDALVDEQKRLIELLKEKRQAVISHAVTKGLDPNAAMKDSGVEWLGEVPEHWEVTKVKHVTSALTSGPRGWSELVSDEGGLFVQSQNIGVAMELNLDEVSRVNVPETAETRRCRLSPDDVVVCITGGRTGSVAHVNELPDAAYINQHVCLLRSKDKYLNGRFLAYTLFSSVGQQQLDVASYGLKQGLSLSNVSDLWVCLPPKTEQDAIITELDAAVARLADLQEHSEASMSILQERRPALISAAVTGKIDVRGVTADVAEAAA